MANTNNYKLLLQAQLDPKNIGPQIRALSEKSVLLLRTEFDRSGMAKFEQALDEIKSKASSVGKISIFGDASGGINRAVIEYRDQLGNVVKEFVAIDDKIAITQVYTENLARDEAAITRIKEQQVKLFARQADEIGRAALNAEKFLAKSETMDLRNPRISAAVDTAKQLKIAVDQGDIDTVRNLNSQLEVQKASLTSVKTGWQSLTESMKMNFRMMVESALSFGIIYGALNQLKQGLQYIVDLNKELVNIQVLQVEGAQTPEQIANLALQYNGLAKELGATTIEVTKGSVEWLRQGKSISETQELLRSTLMLSKLGNLDTAQSTEYLTSILNGFKLEAADATSVVDKLIKFCQNI